MRADAERRAYFEIEQNPLTAAYSRFRKRHSPQGDRCQCGRFLPCSELLAWERILADLDAPAEADR